MGAKAIVKEVVARGALSHADGAVRAEAHSLLVEAYRHLGPALPSILVCSNSHTRTHLLTYHFTMLSLFYFI